MAHYLYSYFLTHENYLLIGQKDDFVIYWTNQWNCKNNYTYGEIFGRDVSIGYLIDYIVLLANQNCCIKENQLVIWGFL